MVPLREEHREVLRCSSLRTHVAGDRPDAFRQRPQPDTESLRLLKEP